MIIGEPPRTQGDLQFRLAGFAVRVHPMFWLIALLMGFRLQKPPVVLAWVMAVFVSILIHELGHAFAFRFYGMDSYIVLYAFGGLAIPMSHRSHNQDSWQRIVISAAGPAAQIAAAILLGGILRLTGHGVPLSGFVGDLLDLPISPFLQSEFASVFVEFFLAVSIYWAILNLLPIYPLDGGQIARELFLRWDKTDPIKHSLILSVAVAALIAIRGFMSGGLYLGVLFGMLGYSNYTALQAYLGSGGGSRGRW